VSSSDDKPRVLKTDLLHELQSIKGLLVDNEPGDSFEFETLADEFGDRAFGGEPLKQDKELHLDGELDLDQELDMDRELDLGLDLDAELDIDIPILDDVVAATKDEDSTGGLLNINEIFDRPPATDSSVTDESAPAGTYASLERQHDNPVTNNEKRSPSPSAAAIAPDMVFLIQELVDEFIPLIEDSLRSRLSELHPDILQELAEKHLNP